MSLLSGSSGNEDDELERAGDSGRRAKVEVGVGTVRFREGLQARGADDGSGDEGARTESRVAVEVVKTTEADWGSEAVIVVDSAGSRAVKATDMGFGLVGGLTLRCMAAGAPSRDGEGSTSMMKKAAECRWRAVVRSSGEEKSLDRGVEEKAERPVGPERFS